MSIEYRDRPIKIAGFFAQLRILLWKNLLLFRRHYLASFFEIILALAFVGLILLLRHMVEKFYSVEQNKPLLNVYDYFDTLPGRDLILYYPNTEIVKKIVTNAIEKIKLAKKVINATKERYFTLYNIFNSIKLAIDFSLVQLITTIPMNDPNQIKIQQYNCLAFNNDELKSIFSFFTPILIEIAFMFTLIINVGNIVFEKQAKIKEYLGIVGIKWYVSWISWMIRSFAIYLVLSVLITIVGVITLNPRETDPGFVSKSIFTTTNFFVAFSILFVYSIQVTLFTILIAQFFRKPFVAKIVTIIIWLLSAINFYNGVASPAKYFLCFLPNIGLSFVFQVIFQFERSGKSLTYNSLYANIYDDQLNIGSILICMLIWSALYMPFTWYIEKIMPGEFGVPLPFYFIFMPSYWCNKYDLENNQALFYVKDQNYVEKEPSDSKATVKIENLCKKFTTGFKKKTVVNNLSISFYENRITGLLGHNGAGKTTTIFMLCGIYPPTSGKALVLDCDIKYQLDEIRSLIGFCPQADILYDTLTVEEHLRLVASIKGFPEKLIHDEINRISSFVGLEKDLNKYSKNLSGGMKRRLSVAMSLIGDSKVIIMDEPTSGLDPYNRRSLWDLIQRYKYGRTIILTTHFMDEADALCDKIAIMNHGELKCYGSPKFLKSQLGHGFKLNFFKAANFNQDLFNILMKLFVGDYFVETNIAAEITIGMSSDMITQISTILKRIEERKEAIGIESYGISSTTIEEVFLRVGQINNNQLNSIGQVEDAAILETEGLTKVFSQDFSSNSGFSLVIQQIVALFLKRVKMFRRRFALAVVMILLPLVAEVILLLIVPSESELISELSDTNKYSGVYKFDMRKYGEHRLPYYLTGAYNNEKLRTVFESYYSASNRPGVTLLPTQTPDLSTYILNLRKSDLKNIYSDYYFGMLLNVTDPKKFLAKLYYSSAAFHTSATIINEVSNLMLKYMTDEPYTINTYNSPLASNDTENQGNDFLEYLTCVDVLPVSLVNMINTVLIAFMISILVIHVARERINGSKSLQLLTGTHFITYWASNYLFDLAICVFNVTMIVSAMKIVNWIKNDPSNEIYAFASDETLGYVYLLLLFSAYSWCAVAYISSFFFKSDIVNFIILFIVLSVAGFLEMIWSFVQLFMSIQQPGKPNVTATFMMVLKIIFAVVFPNVTVKRGLYNLKIRKDNFCINSLDFLFNIRYNYNESYLSFNEPGIGKMLVFSIVQFIFYNLILFMLELRHSFDWRMFHFGKRKDLTINEDKIDSDVVDESERILNSNISNLSKEEPLIVSDLLKRFKKGKVFFNAVNNMSFGVKNTDCFGLLGLNGAGKTTLIKMLIGDLTPTRGEVFINGFSLSRNFTKARQNLGYCPQFDYLPEYLTVKESLDLFSDLKGLNQKEMSLVIDDLIKVFMLEEFKNRQVKKLSGGNKRKLSSAIAFIGKPKLVILDEPTTGMDPASRRYFWNVIKKSRMFGTTVILTSHSMEECEALCTKLGIMQKGQFKCFGSTFHIKQKFGKGFCLSIKCQSSSEPNNDTDIVEQFVLTHIPNSTLKDKQQKTMFFHIAEDASKNETSLALSDIFLLLERNKEFLRVESFALSQTTLEQIFMTFAQNDNTLI